MNKILALPLEDNDAGAATIGEYLCALLKAVWTKEEGFSGKRPFGNGGWQTFIESALVRAGVVDGKLDEDGYLDEVDSSAVNKIILGCIREVFEEKRTVERNAIIQQTANPNEITRVVEIEHKGEMIQVQVHVHLSQEEIERVICPAVDQWLAKQMRSAGMPAGGTW